MVSQASGSVGGNGVKMREHRSQASELEVREVDLAAP